MLVVLLRHAEYVTRVSEEHISALFIKCHVLRFSFFEHLVFRPTLSAIVGRCYPASLVKRDGFSTAFGLIFVLKAVLNNFKLQLAYRTDNLAAGELVGKELCYAFVHQLIYALVELLLLHGINIKSVKLEGQNLKVKWRN